MTLNGTSIRRIELALCRLPLERPVLLGSVRIESREYVTLRIVTQSGLEGFAIGYRSGSPLFEAVQLIAPRLIGRDALMRQAFYSDFEASHIPARAGYVRALSLIDIALWDITAKFANLPLYTLLGGLRTEVPAMPVLGFSYSERSMAEIQEEIERHCANDETLIKVMIKGPEVIANTQYINALASQFGDRVRMAVETHWSWRTILDAMETCKRIDDCGLAFIEDPFLPQQWRLAGELRSKLKTPIAVGEDVLDAHGYLDLVTNVDILRVDATGSGGVMPTMNAIAIASAHGRRVIPHVFPYLHLHIACAQNAVLAVEYIPEHTGTDPVRKLFSEFPTVRRGKFQISDQPGAGCTLNWAAVSQHSQSARVFE